MLKQKNSGEKKKTREMSVIFKQSALSRFHCQPFPWLQLRMEAVPSRSAVEKCWELQRAALLWLETHQNHELQTEHRRGFPQSHAVHSSVCCLSWVLVAESAPKAAGSAGRSPPVTAAVPSLPARLCTVPTGTGGCSLLKQLLLPDSLSRAP